MELYLCYAIPSCHSTRLIKPKDNITFTVHTKIQKHYRKHVLQMVQKKYKLCLSKPLRHKGGVQVEFQLFLASVLDEGEF